MTAIAARGNSSPLSGARAPSQLMPELFAPDVSVWEVRDEKVREELHPEEQQYIERAVAKRQLEFARARYCARQALDRFGLERPSMIPGIAGEPSVRGWSVSVSMPKSMRRCPSACSVWWLFLRRFVDWRSWGLSNPLYTGTGSSSVARKASTRLGTP